MLGLVAYKKRRPGRAKAKAHGRWPGGRYWISPEFSLHRAHGPAVERDDGYKCWYDHGAEVPQSMT